MAMYGIPHIATGDMIREMMARNTELGQQLREVYDRGDLVSDEQIIELIRDRLSRGDTIGGFVLDGFPRTMAQADALEETLREIGRDLDVVFEFQIPDEVGRERMLKRAAEEGRTDDTPEAIDERLRLYHEETKPLIEYYRTRGNLVGVHGDRPVNQVFSEIQQTLEQVAVR
jgi:adenylate kinase